MKQEPPIFMQDSKTSEILKEVKECIPPKTRVYIVGGAIRNALYFKIFNKPLKPTRFYVN